jgi:hypothetical protein
MRRRATTILEMVVVMVILAVLTAVGTVLLATLIKHFGRQRGSYDEVRAASRLAESLRDDAHEATSATVSAVGQDAQTKLMLATADGAMIEYAVVARGIDRAVREGDRVTAREFFRLPSLKSARFLTENSGDGQLLSCVWDGAWRGPNAADGAEDITRPHRIDVALGEEAADE